MDPARQTLRRFEKPSRSLTIDKRSYKVSFCVSGGSSPESSLSKVNGGIMELAGLWSFAVNAGRRLIRGAMPRGPAARGVLKAGMALAVLPLTAIAAWAQAPEVGEANLKLPDLSQVDFFGIDGHKLLLFGILFCVFGLVFGLIIYQGLKNLPVHRSMREISELIYETCKTYLITQGKFLVLLELFIAVVIVLYFGVLLHYEAVRVIIIFLFSVLG